MVKYPLMPAVSALSGAHRSPLLRLYTEVPEIDGNLIIQSELDWMGQIAIYLWHLCTLYLGLDLIRNDA